ncbi:ABC transporter permease [Vallitalea guaymasensis]|uniref:ABC transporter permease n=1 Tax=Vallitalea guaymasensis TaxID=1185412 RepID=UPI000DE37DD9|nr:ABC transporter permease [Vallitalea guaymasensis]
MIRYVIERIALIVLTLFIVLTINFFLLRLMPGTPFDNPKITEVQQQLMKEKYGLDDPAYVQYFRYLKQVVFERDLGNSFKLQDQPVLKLITMKLPHTVKIGTIALIFGVIVGIFLGSIAAIYKNSIWDNLVTILAVIGVSIPGFVMAAFLQYFLCAKLGWFPYIYKPVDALRNVSRWDSFYSSILPAFSLGLFVISSTMRYMRSELVEVLNSDYILLARAKGLSKPKVIFRHALRNALIPVITILGPMAVNILTGGVVVEQFFGVPGLGKLMVNASFTNDYFLILGVNLVYSFLLVTVILIVDLLYGVIDPRIRLKGGGV